MPGGKLSLGLIGAKHEEKVKKIVFLFPFTSSETSLFIWEAPNKNLNIFYLEFYFCSLSNRKQLFTHILGNKINFERSL